jgi:hypothetical protein
VTSRSAGKNGELVKSSKIKFGGRHASEPEYERAFDESCRTRFLVEFWRLTARSHHLMMAAFGGVSHARALG